MSNQPIAISPLRLLAGSGRSGTTWLLDVLCQANYLHPVFEPFHPAGWSQAQGIGRKYAHGMRADFSGDFSPDALDHVLEALIEGSYPRTWIDYRVRPDRLVPRLHDVSSMAAIKQFSAHWRKLFRHRKKYIRAKGSDILVKAIRANLLLPALAARPSTHWGLVVRHPAAVVESQLRLKGVWDPRRISGYYLNDRTLAERMGPTFARCLQQAESDAELFTLIWCVENLLPLEDVKQVQDHVLFYERLAESNMKEWQRLLSCLALENQPDASSLKKPSQQSSEVLGKTRSDKSSGRQSALERLTDDDRADVQRVLDRFDVSFYHMDSLEPVPDQLMNSRPWKTVLES